MKCLIQRVSNAQVVVNTEIVGKISQGLLVFVGIEKLDEKPQMDKMIKRILNYRVFNDTQNKMNLSVQDINASLLVISQFTLAADTKTGTRAGFSTAKPLTQARQLYDYFVQQINRRHTKVATGVFGADMQVSLTNDGPMTFLLSC